MVLIHLFEPNIHSDLRKIGLFSLPNKNTSIFIYKCYPFFIFVTLDLTVCTCHVIRNLKSNFFVYLICKNTVLQYFNVQHDNLKICCKDQLLNNKACVSHGFPHLKRLWSCIAFLAVLFQWLSTALFCATGDSTKTREILCNVYLQI